MATINDLNKSISEMSDEELVERLKEMRLSRRTHKESVRKTKSAKPVELKPSSLSSGQLENLIAELEGMMKK